MRQVTDIDRVARKHTITRMRDDVTMADVMRAVATLQRGDVVQARDELLDLWRRLGSCGGPAQRCVVAHFLADTEVEAERELVWDLRALEAATGGNHEGNLDSVTPDLVAFLPSLHLNAGDAYRRLGRNERARRHADIGLECAHVLTDEGYGATIKEGLKRLRARLAT